MSLTNYSAGNVINAKQNSATLAGSGLSANPGGTNTLWPGDFSIGGYFHLFRGSVDLEGYAFGFFDFQQTFTPREAVNNTYSFQASFFFKNGNNVFVWTRYTMRANANAAGSVDISIPFACTTTPVVIFAPTNIAGQSGIANTIKMQNIIANNTNSSIRVTTSANLTNGTTYICATLYSYIIN